VTPSQQSSMTDFAVPVKTSAWSRENLLSHICELVVSDDQVCRVHRETDYIY
jgi:hypothetical protein